MVDVRTESRPDVLRQVAVLLDNENRRLQQRVREMAQEISLLKGESPESAQLELAKLRELLDARERALFSPSSEKTSKAGATSTTSDTQKTGHGNREQPELQLTEERFELDEADRVCTSCGGELHAMADQFEGSEEVDIVERRFVLVRKKRQKYRCACGNCIETALGPPKLQAKGRYSIDFAIAVALDKYAYHLPLERQVKMMRRQGLHVDSQTLWDQIAALARHLGGIPERIRQHLLAQPVLGADETHWRLMDKRGQDKGVNKRWYVWSLCGDGGAYYKIADSRSTEAACDVLGHFKGVLVTDGYKVYQSAKTRGGCRYISAFCWSHARRKFIAAETSYPNEARAIVALIGELFAIERQLPNAPPDQRLAVRRARSEPVLHALACWAMTLKVLPDSAMGRAMAYMMDLWSGLIRFMTDVRIPLSNNHTERVQRGVVVGRKNHYGSHSLRGTQVAALFYTIVETAAAAGIDPAAYMRHAVEAAIRGNVPLLPHEMKQN